ncbi:helix-turn-helix domain-containing protein [Priestia megaterium]|uniref:helix-turn-helix domain-containing protein n=1 Tax=Priestia megaterium TaxID=1404 RepID=UPI0030000D26
MNEGKEEQEFNFSDIVSTDLDYERLYVPKQKIARNLRNFIKVKGLSIRKLANQMDDVNYSQIVRITTTKNYNIDTLLKILDELDLEIEIKPRKKISNEN